MAYYLTKLKQNYEKMLLVALKYSEKEGEETHDAYETNSYSTLCRIFTIERTWVFARKNERGLQ
ncbi:hypothetical protein COR50_00770 [Chitinophaga caeni]|uniref:Uncharacterized protein n=1 Tax=Chitinophaga caeni TaxID=2029983 RepID=A0A291QPF3_9BACT|nr:hypothetical protein COR50_00770 [Chitinophaga caeni]